MKTKIVKIDADWVDIKNVSRTTVNKGYSEKNATEKFKNDMMVAEHSPIRLINIRWKWESIKSWISTHYSRHTYSCFISTQRNDRTNINRDKSPQDTLVNMDNSANGQNLIDVMRKRLCHQSHVETTEYAKDLKLSLMDGIPELGRVLVPNCVYRCGCPEMHNCGYLRKMTDEDSRIASTDINVRYNAYNEYFLKNEINND